MITIRPLEIKDVPYMLEWMHDIDIQQGFRKNMLSITKEQAKLFCESCVYPKKLSSGDSVHYAIVDDNLDEYLGTISLKQYSDINKSAEFAIVTRKKVHGTGVAKKAVGLILKKAFFDYNIDKVYLEVISNNKAAIRLYERSGFVIEKNLEAVILINGKETVLKKYAIIRDDFDESRYDIGEVW